MDESLKRRIIGSVVLAGLAAMTLPFLLDGEGRIPETTAQIPEAPAVPDTSALHRAVQEDEQAYRVTDLPDTTEPASEEDNTPTDADKPAAEKNAGPDNTPSVRSEVQDSPQEGDFAASGQLNAWSLQMASFGSPANAAKLRDRLRKAGFRAYTKETALSGGASLTQVLVGPEADYDRIQELRNQLTSQGAEFGVSGTPLIVKYRP